LCIQQAEVVGIVLDLKSATRSNEELEASNKLFKKLLMGDEVYFIKRLL
jgi:ribosomal protein L13E